MPFEAKIILDSISASGARLTTVQATYPRFIHSQIMTHRMFSRNIASSRAIPTRKIIERVERDPVIPVSWGKNKKGMQATKEVANAEVCREDWLRARDKAVASAKSLYGLGLHKQIVNRVLEPFMWVTGIITATNFSNFFALRCDHEAQPEIQKIANLIREVYEDSTPVERSWHIPYLWDDEIGSLSLEKQKKVSVARCARVSYLNHEGTREIEKDLKLYDRLLESGHFSPFEHVAEACHHFNPCQSGNFFGWHQLRKSIPGECR